MKRDILLISGSSRPGGTSETLLRMVEEFLRGIGIRCLEVMLREERLDHCKGCFMCEGLGSCRGFDDSMNRLLETMERSDLLLLFVPNHFYGPSSLFKTFLDRLLPLLDYSLEGGFRIKGSRLEGKRAHIFIVQESGKVRDADLLIAPLKRAFRDLMVRTTFTVLPSLLFPEDLRGREDEIRGVMEGVLGNLNQGRRNGEKEGS